MRLVESILGKLLPFAPDLFENLLVVSILSSTIDELRLHLQDDILHLLAHRLSQSVALASSKACEFARKQHDLLLIDGNAVSVL